MATFKGLESSGGKYKDRRGHLPAIMQPYSLLTMISTTEGLEFSKYIWPQNF